MVNLPLFNILYHKTLKNKMTPKLILLGCNRTFTFKSCPRYTPVFVPPMHLFNL
jgi:hypothetical protein